MKSMFVVWNVVTNHKISRWPQYHEATKKVSTLYQQKIIKCMQNMNALCLWLWYIKLRSTWRLTGKSVADKPSSWMLNLFISPRSIPLIVHEGSREGVSEWSKLLLLLSFITSLSTLRQSVQTPLVRLDSTPILID